MTAINQVTLEIREGNVWGKAWRRCR